MLTITKHPAERWIERVDPNADMPKAYDAIRRYRRIIELGLELGARAVLVDHRIRIVLAGRSVVTVTKG